MLFIYTCHAHRYGSHDMHMSHTQMGYGSHALSLLGKYYEGQVASLSEGQLHVDPITSINPDQVRIALYLMHYIVPDDWIALKYVVSTFIPFLYCMVCSINVIPLYHRYCILCVESFKNFMKCIQLNA